MDIILTKEAVAAVQKWSNRSGAHLAEPVIVGLIEAALPHLADRDGIDAEYWTEKFDVLTNAVDALADKVERSTAPDYGKAFQRGVEIGRGQVERTAKPGREEAFRDGVAVGRAEAEARQINSQLVTSGPTDYEVWRDALLIAAERCPREQNSSHGDRSDVEYEARGYVRSLRTLGETQPPDRECEHCGADSSMDHAEDCPHHEEPGGAPDQPDASTDPALNDLADRVAEAVTVLNDHVMCNVTMPLATMTRLLANLSGEPVIINQSATGGDPSAQTKSEADR